MTEAALRPAVIALAGGLREARNERGIGLRRLAAMVDLHHAVLSSFELGQRAPQDTIVAHILGVLRTPQDVRDHLIDLARRSHDRDLIDRTGRAENYLRTAFEQRSSRVTEWSPSLIPDVLQTAEYAGALRDTGLLAPEVTDVGCLLRTACQLALSDKPGPLYTFLIGEAATRPDACTPDVLRDQLDQLRTWTRRPRVAVRLVPAADCPPGLVGPFTFYEHRAGALAVALRHHHGGAAYSTDQAVLTTYKETVRALQRRATENAWP
ncbi:XRE family transcriptional regulator [Amycolatopsis mediterranei S699]|uniref:XRE family transcriptional regulator n=2 Tax=Amycolatopsis mediterranei TaxID=33910 RepID=A0A0H3CUZ9_AMYMU|nr:Scr1 family TA system antitoxin-like transcriptional regulator [Amycolatopsis mediterranei]ADJ41840.1 XRE family transcriptional regulator [Amycolatopsis mediterranei U32]AEK38510.1 XRE family transcriptional regulator [Amycolatopsis mediterranei S699]AFO73551.1 XRE family transcriptional regulator [Amycolatopsis mediterranei S699]AGT80679.1 XRE family transcriptional regulator [Amycolatopsis mediterranei RB]KDO09511.1 XRE family transcriptional regulator [Amycolatopsis mediterranei]